MPMIHKFALGLLLSVSVASSGVVAEEAVAERIQKITRATRWQPLAAIADYSVDRIKLKCRSPRIVALQEAA